MSFKLKRRLFMPMLLTAGLRKSVALACLLLGFTAPALSQETPPPSRAAGQLSAALQAAADGRSNAALHAAQQIGPIAADLVQWRALRAGHGALEDYVAFLETNSHWPLINQVRRPAERKIANQSAADILAYFQSNPPITETGQIALVFALLETGDRTEAEAIAQRLWREEQLSGDSELRLLRNFEAALAPHHAARVDMLLWAGDRNGAQRHLARIDDGLRDVAQARIALQEGRADVTALVQAVPESLQTDPGLMHDRFQFRMRAGNHEGAAELILAQSRDPAGLGVADAWGPRRIFLVRQALSNGDFQLAYDLATPNGLQDGLSYVDLEFLSGFIALEYLGQPDTALNHFRSLRVRSSSPISLGRAGFWEGRAHEHLGDAISAQAAYEFGAEHQSGFYGQLAADRLGLSLDPQLVGGPAYPHWRDTALAQSDLLQATLLLHEAGEWHEARRFVMFLARQLETEAELGALSDLMLAMKEPNFALNIAKIAVQSEIVLPRAYFPLTDLKTADLPVPMDLVKAIARRESEFDPAVVSPADARGLMQVLPGTGQMMATKLGLPFQAADLTRDPELNARLGAAYLAELRREFGPSLALVAAGYNAGPGRPRQWIPRLGDPRDPSVDFIRWVELVPFAETRNYIMRVAESLVIYRSRLAGSSQPIEMEALLRGR